MYINLLNLVVTLFWTCCDLDRNRAGAGALGRAFSRGRRSHLLLPRALCVWEPPQGSRRPRSGSALRTGTARCAAVLGSSFV